MNIDEQMDIYTKGIDELIGMDGLKEKLKKGKKLIIKAGFDPSAPDIHIGHTVLLRKMKQFQNFGHLIYLIIGDFTATIGDPTGKNSLRKRLSKEEVLINAKTYQEQVFKILDKNKTIVKYNSQWLEKLDFHDVLNLCAQTTISRMLERDDFNKRYKENKPISLMEFLYPLVQGYDSVAIKADVELGGTDQKFNLLVGRDLMKNESLSPQSIITMPILEGLDGIKKMSKSLNNYIGLNDSPKDMFGKTMSIPDNLIIKYFTLITDVSKETIKQHEDFIKKGGNPRDIKILLSKEIVSMYYSQEIAENTHSEFINIFKKGGIPNDVPTYTFNKNNISIIELLNTLNETKSNSEYRRLIKQGAISINNEKITDDKKILSLEKDSIVKIGKKEFYKIDLS